MKHINPKHLMEFLEFGKTLSISPNIRNRAYIDIVADQGASHSTVIRLVNDLLGF